MAKNKPKKNKKNSLVRGLLAAAFCVAASCALQSDTSFSRHDPRGDDMPAPETVTLFDGGQMERASFVNNYDREFTAAFRRESQLICTESNLQTEVCYMRTYKDSVHTASIATLATEVNEAVNKKIAYVSDKDNYGCDEYWAAPAETLAKCSGDCEDFALLKYKTLREMGVSVNRLYIAVVDSDKEGKVNHAILMVDTATGGRPPHFVILSNGNGIYEKPVDPAQAGFAYYGIMNDRGEWFPKQAGVKVKEQKVPPPVKRSI
ncbi:MAG: hypothetical protein GC185_03165 [Alphaproteobacteria bacterium]|nr:hypothetical protein [Alphaproteobacteria bacterium]